MAIQITKGLIGFPSLKKDMSLSSPRIFRAKTPRFVTIPLAQHEGAPAIPCVKAGDSVLAGTRIGDPDGDLSAAVHSSTSGRVKVVGIFPHPYLGEGLAVQIESDGRDASDPSIRERDPERLSQNQILEILRASGVVSLSSRGMPIHLELAPPLPQPSRRILLVSGLECEPYFSSAYLLMMERAHEMIQGVKILKRLTGRDRAVLAVGDDELKGLETINSKLFTLGENVLEAVSLPALYPQGHPRRLVRDLLTKEASQGRDDAAGPESSRFGAALQSQREGAGAAGPESSRFGAALQSQREGAGAAAGVLVLDVATVLAVYEAVKMGRPLYERVVTVTGECVVEPKNLLVRIGTHFQDLLKNCQGILRKPGRFVLDSVLSGVALENLEAPVVKTSRGLVALAPEEMDAREAEPCIRCGWCVAACPVFINPALIAIAVESDRLDVAREYGASACIACGNCSYVCPSKRPMVELVLEVSRRGVS